MVITDEGLVGQVNEVGLNWAKVITIIGAGMMGSALAFPAAELIMVIVTGVALRKAVWNGNICKENVVIAYQ